MTSSRRLDIVLALFGAAVSTSGLGACGRAGAVEHVEAEGAEPVAVTTEVVARRPVARALMLTGTLIANRTSEVAADAVGKVTAAPIERGTVVAAGAILARLDNRSAALTEKEAYAQSDGARVQQRLAATECARAEKLFAEGVIHETERDRARADCAVARARASAAGARARLARKDLGDAVVRAPFGGVIAERLVAEGEYVRPDTHVATLVEIDPLRLEISVPEAAVPVLQRAAEVEFQVTAFPDERFQATVRYVGPAVRRQTRDLLVEAVVPNQKRRLLPGMFASVRLALGRELRPVVPAAALKRDGEVDRAYVVMPTGRAEERLVSLGAPEGKWFAVMSGLADGETVVSPWVVGLRDGALVRRSGP
jgi:membrane fusion protein (multidrug efflux system)